MNTPHWLSPSRQTSRDGLPQSHLYDVDVIIVDHQTSAQILNLPSPARYQLRLGNPRLLRLRVLSLHLLIVHVGAGVSAPASLQAGHKATQFSVDEDHL